MSITTQHNKNIRHIVLSGGGAIVFPQYGIVYETFKDGIWNFDTLLSMYGTSAGTITMCLAAFAKVLGWEIVNDYLIKRPWHYIFTFDFDTLSRAFDHKGMFSVSLVEEILRPLVHAVDKTVDITLAEFHELTQMEIHFMTAELVKFELVDVSHKTHPEWTLKHALYSSVCLPCLFTPLFLNDRVYMDGSLFQHYPLKSCIDGGAVPDEILGITNYFESPQMCVPKLDNLLDYIMYISGKVLNHVLMKNPIIKHNVIIPTPDFISVYDIYQTVQTQVRRIKEIDYGVKIWKTFRAKREILTQIRLRGAWVDMSADDDTDDTEDAYSPQLCEYPLCY